MKNYATKQRAINAIEATGAEFKRGHVMGSSVWADGVVSYWITEDWSRSHKAMRFFVHTRRP